MAPTTTPQIIVIATVVSISARAETPQVKLSLAVRIYDYAGVEKPVLKAAQRQATEILDRAGVEMSWENCSTPQNKIDHYPSCTTRAGATLIQLRIHPREKTRQLTRNALEFGYSVPSQAGYGVVAGVHLDRTRSLARETGGSLGLILGHTIAHEVGHLLLGSQSHARQGIMRPRWNSRDLHLAHTGALGFTKSQSKRIRKKTFERIALQRGVDSSNGAERTLALFHQ